MSDEKTNDFSWRILFGDGNELEIDSNECYFVVEHSGTLVIYQQGDDNPMRVFAPGVWAQIKRTV